MARLRDPPPPLELVPPLFNEIQISGDLVYDVILGAPQARKFCDFGPLKRGFAMGSQHFLCHFLDLVGERPEAPR